jgi:hypothetical protein
MAVTTAKQAENKGERTFGRRLHRLAIKAGNVVNKCNLTTIYVEGLLLLVQSGLRMHLNPCMSFETAQRYAHNLKVSLRQTIRQSAQPVTHKFPPGVKGLLPRECSVQSVDSTETANLQDPQSFVDDPNMAALEAALENTHAGNSYPSPSSTLSGSSFQPWRPPVPRSASHRNVSIPT